MKQPGNMAAAESRGFVSFVVGGGFFLGGGVVGFILLSGD